MILYSAVAKYSYFKFLYLNYFDEQSRVYLLYILLCPTPKKSIVIVFYFISNKNLNINK